ncbi:Isotrichodermin C-15 hydroxylase [Neolecta irregularis DAH-3]|uniref:Isotrichodermin C-15 hydroxylase n=1 Tax=Neolecta irregularis (strain DAH-3) TaxID=1198029 RepID=A0A1U7LRN1_NEOID|nr:Isotrichodermin C-15 hydroxylase [Neolecta irregularis DAH-3]|eukprot:OLL25304.1 Isotrichodermin C-15 hydroxylase [Neolecta irregularis DAH-3]
MAAGARDSKNITLTLPVLQLAYPISALYTFEQLRPSSNLGQVYLHPLAAFPGPFWAKVNPLWPFMLLYKGQRHKSLRRLHAQYGDHVRVGINTLSICHKDAHQATRGHDTKFMKDKAFQRLNDDPLIQGFATERDTTTYLRMKRAVAPSFSQKAIDGIEDNILEKVKLFCALVRKVGNDGKTPLDMAECLSYLVFDILGIFCFGKSYGMLEVGGHHPLPRFVENCVILGSYGFVLSWLAPIQRFIPKSLLKKRIMILEDYNYRANERISRGYEQPDLFEHLYQYVNGLSSDPGILRKHLIANLDSFMQDYPNFSCWELFHSGFIFSLITELTTSAMLTSAIFQIAKHPHVLHKLGKELEILSPDQITNGKLAELEYLNAVIRETSRLMPPVLLMSPRCALDDVEVGGHIIPKDTSVIVPNWSIYHDDRYFTNPDVFMPERWLDPGFHLDQTMGKTVHLPFSVGVHACIGQTLVQAELRLTLAYWVLCFDAKLVDPNAPYEFKEHLLLADGHCHVNVYPRDAAYDSYACH